MSREIEKKNFRSVGFSWTLMLVALLVPACVGEIEVPETGAFKIPLSEGLRVDMPGSPTLEEIDDKTRVRIAGLPDYARLGLPVLPVRTVRMLLPFGHKVAGIEVATSERIELTGSYDIQAAQEPQPVSRDLLGSEMIRDQEIYESDEIFPPERFELVGIQRYRGYAFAVINLFPVEYRPRSGRVAYHNTLWLTIHTSPDPWILDNGDVLMPRPDRRDFDRIRSSLDDRRALESYQIEQTGLVPENVPSRIFPIAGDREYIIITSDELAPSFQALVDHKISKGLSALLVSTSQIYQEYDGARPDGASDNPTRIRNFIKDAYQNHGAEFVLLGGDSDKTNAGGEAGPRIVPHRGLTATVGSYHDSDIPADLYYACLDGSFDDDGDGKYGEANDGPGGGEVDLVAEILVGRAPVDSVTEANFFVQKVIQYETSTDPYLSKVLLAGEYLWPQTYGADYMEEIRLGADTGGYHTEGFSADPTMEVDTIYDKNGTWSANEMVQLLNSNYHIVNHLGHANVTYSLKFQNATADALANTEPFIIYSQGCYSGSFDNRTTGGATNSSDCIAEHMLAQSSGAVAVLMNSRYGWGMQQSTLGPSQYYNREFWDAVLGEGQTRPSEANRDSKEDNIGRINGDAMRWCYYQVNLLGDPETSIHLTGNQRPQADAGDDQSVAEGQFVSLDGSASYDPDNEPLTYHWTQTAGTQVQLSDAEEAQPTFTAPQVGADETLVFSLVVSDGAFDSYPDNAQVTVNDQSGNNRPVADAGQDQQILAGTAVTLDGSGSWDPDGDSLEFSWAQIGGPAVQLSNPAAMRPLFDAPDVTETSVLTFQLVVADADADSLPDSVNVEVMVDWDFEEPSSDTPISIPDSDSSGVVSQIPVSMDGELTALEVDVNIIHQYIGALTVQLESPDGTVVVLHNRTGADTDDIHKTYAVSACNGQSPAGTWRLRVADWDAYGDNGQLSNWTLRGKVEPKENQGPVADAGDAFEVNEGEQALLDGGLSYDPDGDALTYAWTQTAGPSVALSDPASERPSFIAPNVDQDTDLRFSLVVSDGLEQSPADSVTVSVVSVANPPQAAFDYLVDGLMVTFVDQSTDADLDIASWSWDFGDGSGSAEQRSQHMYQAQGIYTVSLTVTDGTGLSDSLSREVEVGGGAYCESISTSCHWEWIDEVQIGGFLHASGKSNYSDFTDLVAEVNPGAHPVQLTPGFSGSGFTEVFRIWIDFNDDMVFDESQELVFSGSGRGVVEGSLTIPDTAAPGDRRMRISMKYAQSPGPCEMFTYGEVEDYTIRISESGGSPPMAEFEYQLDCATIFLTDISTDQDGDIVTWHWDFGDNATSSDQNPAHTYGGPGNYTVSLTVTDAGDRTDSASHQVTVNSTLVASFNFSAQGSVVTFDDESSSTECDIVSWFWTFGDGASSASQNPVHSYSAAGTYQVRMVATDAIGNSDDLTRQVTVQPDDHQVVPSNIPASLVCINPGVDLNLTTAGVVNTDSCSGLAGAHTQIVTQGGGAPDICVMSFGEVNLQADLNVIGSSAFALVACGNMTVNGVIRACADGRSGGPGGFSGGLTGADGEGYGAGGGQGGWKYLFKAVYVRYGGGGGGFGGTGGDSADPGLPNGTENLTPLVGGSGGGGGADNGSIPGGGGGGAIQLVCNAVLDVKTGGGVNACGAGGGVTSGTFASSGAGGGAGGGILLEGFEVNVSGTLAANGGGGGGGRWDEVPTPGSNGGFGDTPAAGGSAGGTGFSGAGGAGGACDQPDGSDGGLGFANGGGGGAAGRIRINTPGASAGFSGTASPSQASGLFTQGNLPVD